MPISPSDEYFTPRPRYEPDASETSVDDALSAGGSSDSPHRAHSRRGRSGTAKRHPWRFASALFSLGCVGTLTVAMAFPLGISSSSAAEPEPQAASIGQSFRSSEVGGDLGIDAIGPIEVGEDLSALVPTTMESGLVSPAGLPDTELRLPFDEEWPLTDGFAYRTYPVEQFHDAQDIAAPEGTPIRSIGSGTVVQAGYSSGGCGFGLKVQHRVGADTLTALYCHMQADSHDYAVGDTISIGDQVGLVGSTGLSLGPHLHLSLKVNGTALDPLPYLESRIERQSRR